jgi:hypothetical protein
MTTMTTARPTPTRMRMPGPATINRVLFLAVAALVLAEAATRDPTPFGDAGEYFLMAESFANHTSPELRPEDVASLRRRAAAAHLALVEADILSNYFEAVDGRRYCYHFWGYSLASLPARWVLRGFGLPELRALQVTGALAFCLALGAVAFVALWTEEEKRLYVALLFFSPLLWFILWSHPEVYSASLVVIALALRNRGWARAAVFSAALAATQNPPLVLLVAFLWWKSAVDARGGLAPRLSLVLSMSWRRGLLSALAAAPLAVPPLFFYRNFSVLNLAARETAGLEHVSLRKALELFFDPNLGLLPFVPVTLALFLGVGVWSARARRGLPESTQILLLVFALALGCSANRNWNNGTSGPSRYAVWVLPLLVHVVVTTEEAAELRRTRRLYTRGLWLAVAVQAAVVAARGGFTSRMDYLEHSAPARFVLEHAPALYNPSHEIFVERTTGSEAAAEGPFVYARGGRCFKALAKRKHEAALIERCGGVPESRRAFFAARPRSDAEAREWVYVDY